MYFIQGEKTKQKRKKKTLFHSQWIEVYSGQIKTKKTKWKFKLVY